MQVNPYIMFGGRCEEAIEFYRKAVDAQVVAKMTFSEAPEGPPPGQFPPGWDKKIMHSELRIGDSKIMGSDGMGRDEAGFKGMSLALTVGSDADAKRRFDALAAGGQVTMPLTKTFFSSSFGMLVDKFGVSWMIVAE
jgi:PhnB protein